MVCAESSASFSKTAAFFMSSLGEATERVTSIVCVWVWLHLPRLQAGGAGAARLPRRRRKAPGDLLRRRGSLASLASGGTARLLSLLNGEQKWAVEGQLLQKNRIPRPAPERSPPGRRDASNEKDKKGSGVQNEVRVFLVACSWAERRAGTASAALSHPPPPPTHASQPPAAVLHHQHP